MRFLRILWECLFVWRIKTDERRLSEAQVILGCAMGDEGNRVLARIVHKLHTRLSLSLVLQGGIADNLSDLPKALVVRRHRSEGQYLDTREVILQAWEVCRKRGWTRAIVVAHPDHLWRCVRAAEKIGFEVVGISDTTSVPYDPPWNRFRFMLRELCIVRPLYLINGFI